MSSNLSFVVKNLFVAHSFLNIWDPKSFFMYFTFFTINMVSSYSKVGVRYPLRQITFSLHFIITDKRHFLTNSGISVPIWTYIETILERWDGVQCF